MAEIQLRSTKHADLEQLFLFQIDKDACHQAAFMAKDHQDKEAYMRKWTRLLNDETVNTQTIWVNGVIVGSLGKFFMDGHAEITYWIDKPYWAQGIASAALTQFLTIETIRPIFGRVAFDNIGSQKVLEKCGFVKIGADRGFATARGAEIEECIYKLSS